MERETEKDTSFTQVVRDLRRENISAQQNVQYNYLYFTLPPLVGMAFPRLLHLLQV